MNPPEDFFTQYFAYTANGEVPAFFHRWSVIAGLGAYLGRSYFFQHGHSLINPNIYCMLIGSPGTRKSTAIKMMQALLRKAGYTSIAAEKTSKEKFLMDMAGEVDPKELNGHLMDTVLETNLWGVQANETAEMFIMADEFNIFMGHGNIEFVSLLGTLWDYTGEFSNRIKTGKSIRIQDPTVSILGGNTPAGFSMAFPPESLGQGFFSRLMLVYGESNGRRVTFPKAPDPRETEALIKTLREIKSAANGPSSFSPQAEFLIDKIYHTNSGVDDIRFESYNNRRFTHLIKLCLIVSAARRSNNVQESDVLYANTILTHTERLMPRALGEFGKSKHSDVAQKVLMVLEGSLVPATFHDIWEHVAQDLERQADLSTILQNLAAAKKIQQVEGGLLPVRKVWEDRGDDMVDFSLLTNEERGL